MCHQFGDADGTDIEPDCIGCSMCGTTYQAHRCDVCKTYRLISFFKSSCTISNLRFLLLLYIFMAKQCSMEIISSKISVSSGLSSKSLITTISHPHSANR